MKGKGVELEQKEKRGGRKRRSRMEEARGANEVEKITAESKQCINLSLH